VREADVQLALSDGRRVAAVDSDNDGTYEAAVGTASVSAVRVVDGCGNSE
jgi:hypothetical protein